MFKKLIDWWKLRQLKKDRVLLTRMSENPQYKGMLAKIDAEIDELEFAGIDRRLGIDRNRLNQLSEKYGEE